MMPGGRSVGPVEPTEPEDESGPRNYRRLLIRAVVSVGLVSLVPLFIMTTVNYIQYQQAFRSEMVRPISRLTRTAKQSLEFYLSERQSALDLIALEESLENLTDPNRLDQMLGNLTQAFGGFIDLGLIDEEGRHISYAGPYALDEINYAEDEWFQETWNRGAYTSEVFLGHRDVPHFVIAVSFESSDQNSFLLRSTIDTEAITEGILHREDAPFADAFLVNREGVLQTSSGLFGEALGRSPLSLPSELTGVQVEEMSDEEGRPLVVGVAGIEHSPFTVVLVSHEADLGESWLYLRRNLLFFLIFSVIAILVVVVWGSRSMVQRMAESDFKRNCLQHRMEYSNKMAAIGRLASGVAHEINNPLAIINEKTGYAKDLLTFTEELPPKEKLLELIESVLYSVKRCGRITHRLLGFAKHVDVEHRRIDVPALVLQVFGFLEKEASYRNLRVTYNIPDDLPSIFSDQGQLQQVFLNIINNAFAAVDDGGRIRIAAEWGGDNVAVTIRDNGTGIPQEDLVHIFEPFFSTKGPTGTGLGLSVTYGIVEKLGGRIEVESTVGEGTEFTVTLPIGSE